jgi:CheY-like chemotaxis protein
MPDMNGLETVRHLRSSNFTSPVIAQTAYAMSDDRDKCIAAGFNEYITKPIKPEELLEKMERFIGK